MKIKETNNIDLGAVIKGLSDASAKVGWFESAQYKDGTPVAMVAYVQEHGSPKSGIPPRPFMRTTETEKKEEWANTAKRVSRAVLDGHVSPSDVVESVALAAEGHIAKTIRSITTPALKQSTINARKNRLADKGASIKKTSVMGIEKPLVDSGLMLRTLTSEVVKK
jgi:hypothetical protein